MIETIDKYLTLEKTSGGNFKTCCLFHREETPSFLISEKRNLYHCFGCGKEGKINELIELLKKRK